MGHIKTLAVVLILAIAALAQQPQTSDVSGTQPLFPVNAKFVQGVGPGYWPTAGAGLTLNLTAGTVWCTGTIRTYAGGTLSMTNSATNYVYLDPASSCAPASSTSAFSSSVIPIAVVVASGGSITTITDDRGVLAAFTTSSIGGSITCGQMPALTGDATSSAGSCATTLATVDKRRTCAIIVGADNAGAALATADIAPQGRQCFIPFAATVVEIEVAADGGTPNVVVARNRAGSLSDLTSAALATAGSGGIACSNTGGTTGLDGATSCSATLQNTGLNAGDYIETHSAAAGGVAKRMSIFVTYTVN